MLSPVGEWRIPVVFFAVPFSAGFTFFSVVGIARDRFQHRAWFELVTARSGIDRVHLAPFNDQFVLPLDF